MKSIAFIILILAQMSFAQVRPLLDGDLLSQAVSEINQEWTDNNISTGTTTIRAGQWELAMDKVPAAQVEILKAQIKKIAGKKGSLVITETNSRKFEALDIPNLVKAFKEGNDYAPENKESTKVATDQIRAILDKLTQARYQDLYTIEIKAVYSEEGETRNVYLTSFTSAKSDKTVLFFIIEGKM